MTSQPLFNPATHYRMRLRGRVKLEWLQSFAGSTAIRIEPHPPEEAISVIDLHADQSGMVGLVRRLHGLGITILQIQVCE